MSRQTRLFIAINAAVLIVSMADWVPVRSASAAPVEVRESFDGKAFDRSRWTINPREPPGLRAEFDGRALHLIIPPASTNRAPVAFKSQFGLEGDFEIRVDYQIKSFPRPEREWANIEIEIEGSDGSAAVIRTNHSKEGSGYSLWYQPREGSGKSGSWTQVPTQAAAGTLRLERAGARLRYWGQDRGKTPRRIGEVVFGQEPVDHVSFRVTVPALRRPIDLTLDEVQIKADRVVTPLPPVVPLLWRRQTWIAIFIVLSLIGGLWIWAFRAGEQRPRSSVASRAGSTAPIDALSRKRLT